MARLAWLTDIHLDLYDQNKIGDFLKTVGAGQPDIVLITGDIGEAHTIEDYLVRFAGSLNCPVYFVLGNHDYYSGSINRVRMTVTRLSANYETLFWLPLYDVVELSPHSALIGHGGWSDGGYGDFLNSPVMLNDYVLIAELARHVQNRATLLETIHELGQEAGDHLRRVLPKALARYAQVYIALHSPPFKAATWHEGRTPDDSDPYLPHFSCKAAGDALLDIVPQFPHAHVTVLCGHTHGKGAAQILPNLQVLTGGAEYGSPQVQRVFEV